MSSIDERIVEMKFDNSQFEKNSSTTMSTLDKLKKALSFTGAADGLEEINKTAAKVNLAGLADGVQNIASKFSALSIIGITALTNIANKAVSAGIQIANSLTIAPISAGFGEYETKIGSIQTMLANTARYGTTLDQVSASLNDLNTYADKTIYNFGDMTKNIGLFTNAGIGVEDATKMIKGFSNAAAASGTTAQGAAGAAYQLSQALSTGTIRLMDWRSLTNAGMGNKNMQDDLISIADAMGTVAASGTTATDIQKDFNGSLEKGWLSADVMSNYLQIMAGDMSDAEMKALGLSDAQIEGLKKTAKTAEDAATKVRTWSQLLGTLQESVGSGWSQTFELIFGDFDEATTLFTKVNDKLGLIINSLSDARNNLIKTWSDLGGRSKAIEALSNTFDALLTVIGAVKEAFQEVFPPMTAQQLYNLTEQVAEFTEKLKMGEGTLTSFKTVIKGFAALLHIVWEAVKAVTEGLGKMFEGVSSGAGGFLDGAANIAEFVIALDNAISSGEFFTKITGSIADIFLTLIDRIKSVLGAFGWFKDAVESAGDVETGSFEGVLDFVSSLFEGLAKILSNVDELLSSIMDSIGRFVTWVIEAGKKIGRAAGIVAEAIGNFLDAIDPIKMLGTINLGLIGVFLYKLSGMVGGMDGLIKKVQDLKPEQLGKGLKAIMDALKTGEKEEGLGDKIKSLFGSLTTSLKTMQNTIKATTLLIIAAAITMLVGSLVALSTLDTEELATGIGAVSILLGELMITLDSFTKILKKGGLEKIIIVATGLVLFAAAVRIMVTSVQALSGLDWQGLAKGLVGVAAILGMIAGFTHILGDPKKIITTAVAMLLLSVSVKSLVGSVMTLADSGWEELAKGLLGVAALLAMIAGFTQIMGSPKKMIAVGIGMILLAHAIGILTDSLKEMSKMSWEEIAKGLATLAGALLLLAGGLYLMTGSIVGAGALLIAAFALGVLAPVLKQLGQLSWEEIAKGLVAIGGALLVLAGGLTLMIASIPGAIALGIAATGLTTLAPVLEQMGQLSWGGIAKGMVALAGSLIILAVGLTLMAASLPGATALVVAAGALNILAPALAKMGELSWGGIAKGMVALAGSLLILAVGLTMMVAAMPGALALGAVSVALMAFIPVLQALGGLDWGLILGSLGKLAAICLGLSIAMLLLIPTIPVLAAIGAAIVILGSGMYLAGMGMTAFSAGLMAIIGAGASAAAMAKSMIGLIPALMTAIGVGFVSFLTVVASSGTTLVATIVTIISSILTAITTLVPQVITTAVTLFSGLLQAIQIIAPQLISTGLILIMDFVTAIVTLVPFLVDAGMQLITGILTGIATNIGEIVTVAVSIVVNFINAISANLPLIVQAGFNLIISFINSLTDGINQNADKLRTAMKGLATAMIDAITGGLGSQIGSVVGKVGELGSSAISKFKEFFNLSNGAEIAGNVVRGLVNGINSGISAVTQAARDLASKALNAAKDFLGIHSPSKKFFEVGEYSDEGLANGLDSKSNQVTRASKNVAKSALFAMNDALKGVDDILSKNVDNSPVITPVLDLSQVSKDSAALGTMLNTGASYSAALKASATLSPSEDTVKTNSEDQLSKNSTSVVINQSINSPKAVSAAEVYRGTKNLVSVLKGELA